MKKCFAKSWVYSLGLVAMGVIPLGGSAQGDGFPLLAMHTPLQALENSSQQTSGSLQGLFDELNLRLSEHPADYEASLLKSILLFREGQLDKALTEINALVARAPDFNLAYLVRGDILMAQVHGAKAAESSLLEHLTPEQQNQLKSLLDEARMRLVGGLVKHGNKLPRQLLALGESVNRAILVDKSQHRLYVLQRSGNDVPPKVVMDFYVSTGKQDGNKEERGDLRTPEGVYFVTSWIPKEKLPEKYGVGAFPMNYPNELDQRMGKTGDGIWLHGTDTGFFSRPPQDSEGCVVLTNADFNVLKQYITPGLTPVVIAEQVEWVDESDWLSERKELFAALESWREDWESLDVDRYLSHYAEGFWSAGFDRNSWASRKRLVAQGKTFQKIKLSDISLFLYPRRASNGQAMAVVRLNQLYTSNNYTSELNKRIYLNRENGHWQILYEGS